jgi:hypothetical protein
VFETRKEGELILIFAKKKIVQERENWECPLSSKNNKKGIFQRTFSRLRVSTHALLKVLLP